MKTWYWVDTPVRDGAERHEDLYGHYATTVFTSPDEADDVALDCECGEIDFQVRSSQNLPSWATSVGPQKVPL